MSVLVGHDLGVVTMFRDEAPYLVEWVEYHLLAGVTRFWLYDHLSTDASLDVLAPYVASGAATVIQWPRPYAPGDLDARRAAQMAAIQDGLRRAVGEVEWVAVIDVDEFLLPMRDRTVTECLVTRYGDVAGVYANWRMFGTGGVFVSEGQPLLDRLTACSLPGHPENWSGKSIVRPDAVDLDRVWHPHHFPLLPGASYRDGGGRDIPRDERGDVVLRGEHRDGYLRVNHYTLRDEGFYRSRRLRDAMAGQLNKSLPLLLEHHDSFSRTRDVAILDFLVGHSVDVANWGAPGAWTGVSAGVASSTPAAVGVMRRASWCAASPRVDLSIVLVTGREEPRVDWVLDEVGRQSVADDAIEIVVVDARGRTASELGYRDVPGVVRVVVTAPKPTPWQGPGRVMARDWWAASSARNTGIALCLGDYVAFLDDRQHLGPRWLEVVRQGSRDRSSVLAGSYDIHDDPADPHGIGTNVDHRRIVAPLGRVDCGGAWLYGGSMAMPLEWLLDVNGLEEGCDGLSGEDCVLGLMLANRGRRIDFVAEMYSRKDRCAGSGHGLMVLNKGTPPVDKSSAALGRFGGRVRTEFTPDLRRLRESISAGEDFPGVDPGAVLDWYDGRPIREMDDLGTPYRTNCQAPASASSRRPTRISIDASRVMHRRRRL